MTTLTLVLIIWAVLFASALRMMLVDHMQCYRDLTLLGLIGYVLMAAFPPIALCAGIYGIVSALSGAVIWKKYRS